MSLVWLGKISFWRFSRIDLQRQKSVGVSIDTSSTAQGGGGSFKKRKTIGEIGCCEAN